MVDSFSDSIWAEVEDLVRAEPSAASWTDLEIGTLTRGALSVVCEPAESGNPFILEGSPGCPHCGSTKVRSFMEHEDQPRETDVEAMTHHRWDQLSPQDKSAAIRATVNRLLGEE